MSRVTETEKDCGQKKHCQQNGLLLIKRDRQRQGLWYGVLMKHLLCPCLTVGKGTM